MTAKDKADVQGMILAALEAAMGITFEPDVTVTPTKVTPARKRRNASTKAAPKATFARKGKGKRAKGERPAEWLVRGSWKGEEASPRMETQAVKAAKQQGGSDAVVAKRIRGVLDMDKLDMSTYLGTCYGLPIVVKD